MDITKQCGSFSVMLCHALVDFVPLAAMHAHAITLILVYFTADVIYFGSCAVIFLLPTLPILEIKVHLGLILAKNLIPQ